MSDFETRAFRGTAVSKDLRTIWLGRPQTLNLQGSKTMMMTLGGNGSLTFDKPANVCQNQNLLRSIVVLGRFGYAMCNQYMEAR